MEVLRVLEEAKQRGLCAYVSKPIGKATLRLYLNDPAIFKLLKQGKLPVPLKLKGEVEEGICLGKELTKHIFFVHGRRGKKFMTVFFDFVKPPSLRERLSLSFWFGLSRILRRIMRKKEVSIDEVETA